MAEKKTKKYVAASEESKKNKAAQDAGEQTVTRKVKEAQPVGNPGPLRFGAVALWVLALVFEVLALLVFLGKVDLRFTSYGRRPITSIRSPKPIRSNSGCGTTWGSSPWPFVSSRSSSWF